MDNSTTCDILHDQKTINQNQMTLINILIIIREIIEHHFNRRRHIDLLNLSLPMKPSKSRSLNELFHSRYETNE